ncbi:hypothetical protein [Salinigranum marinum]|uniref:hypothetical protein n=1 Tax=Salinigranum marinum TaxID=1515595 RepID=UPI002989DEDC|nr:hypothetical protein [Salinigranum marinum]
MSLRTGSDRLRLPEWSALSLEPRPLADWTLLGLFGVVLTTAVFLLVGGLVGVFLTIGLVVTWMYLPTVYSYALGHVFALGATARAFTVVELLFVELGLICVLLGPFTRATLTDRGSIARSTLGFGFTLFGVIVVGLAFADRLWITTVLILLAGGALVYGLHRYELASLGLVSDDDELGTVTGGAAGRGRDDTPAETTDRGGNPT